MSKGTSFLSGICLVNTGATRRAIQHIRQLLDVIGQFPRVNPSSSNTDDVDIQKLQRQIRSRYKALCSSLGVRPRVQVATSNSPASILPELEQEESDDVTDLPEMSGISQNNRVAPGSSIPVWKIDKRTGSKSAVTNMDLSF